MHFKNGEYFNYLSYDNDLNSKRFLGHLDFKPTQ